MWIGDIEFPDRLIEAHRDGDLVIFVGAGASVDAPSDLPTFRKLAQEIAAEAQILDVSETALERPDEFLGGLADERYVDVKSRIAARIGIQTSKPNRLHAAIAALSASQGAVRVVTTNYDSHLSSALAQLGVEFREYVGPAVPMGDDFAGVVHLHGNLQDVPGLVATDRDFGRAYLLDAWAARFLERMFARYTVLFIGYSHSDIVITYLGRALGRSSEKRFILTSDPDAPTWNRLGITPVAYLVEGDSHEALATGLEAWTERASMGLLQHRQRIANLVSSSPSGIPEDASYLEAAIADPARARLFTEAARTKEWLSWAATQPEFRKLFDPAGQPSASSQALAYWFAEHFVMNEELSDTALELVREAGENIGPTLWSAIGHVLHIADKPRPAFLGRWLMLLLRNDPGIRQDWLEYALVASSWPTDRDVALQLFDHLTEPAIGLRPSYGLAEAPGIEIRLRGDRHWVRESWDKTFGPHLGEVANDVLVIVDHHLRSTHRLLVSAGAANPDWDPVSFSRSAIEPHEQDRIDDAIDVLIDAGRDALEALLTADHPAARPYLENWADSEIPILRRLGIHGWIHRVDVDDTEKMAWLRQQGWLFDHQLRHEVFRLIETALPGAKPEIAEQLVLDAVAGPPGEGAEDRHHAYERFNALVWINKHAPDLRSAEEALARIKADHADFEERVHPDLVSWMEGGFAPSQRPMTTEDLHEAIREDPTGAVSALAFYRDSNSPFEGPTWGGALATLREAVEANPKDGLAILSALAEPDPEIVGAIIRGWGEIDVTPELALSILRSLAPLPLSTIALELSQLLSEGGGGGGGVSEWHRQPGARELATRLWNELPSDYDNQDQRDSLGRAINMPAGQLALFWIRVVSAEWRAAGDEWEGFSDSIRMDLDSLLGQGNVHSDMVEVVFASQVLFFFAADEAWCRAHVLPLLDWTNPNRARRCWQAFLIWGRWNDGLLTAGLLDHYLEVVAHLGDFSEEPRRQVATHLAGVALTSEHDPLSWVRRFIVTAPVPDRAEWARQVAWMMDRLPTDAVEHQWNRWIREYWKDRLNSVPSLMTREEASAMAEWVVPLTASIDEGIALALAHPAGLEEHGDLLHRLNEDRVNKTPASFAKLLGHLLRGTNPPFWGGHYLSRLVPQLRPHADPDDLNTIIEEAVRLGSTEAPQW